MLKRMILLLGVIVVISACSVPGVYLAPNDIYVPTRNNKNQLVSPHIIPITDRVIRSQPPYQYRIGPYDSLNIAVWNHPELTQTAQLSTVSDLQDLNSSKQAGNISNRADAAVDSEGYIYFPFAGKVRVAGLTVDQARVRLTRRIARYIRHPQVSVQVAAFRNKEVSVVGELRHPGTQPLTNKPLSLMDAINQAQGINPLTADTGHIYVIRAVNYRTGNLPQPNIKYPKATYNKVDVYWLRMRSAQSMLFAESFYLQPNDVVYVSSAAISDWNRVVSQIMPTVQTIWYTHALTE